MARQSYNLIGSFQAELLEPTYYVYPWIYESLLPFMILALFNASFQADKQSSLLSFKNDGSIFIGKIAIPFFWKSAIA